MPPSSVSDAPVITAELSICWSCRIRDSDLALGVLGGVVVAVLRKVAERGPPRSPAPIPSGPAPSGPRAPRRAGRAFPGTDASHPSIRGYRVGPPPLRTPRAGDALLARESPKLTVCWQPVRLVPSWRSGQGRRRIGGCPTRVRLLVQSVEGVDVGGRPPDGSPPTFGPVDRSRVVLGAFRIAVIGGDGIGPDVVAEALKVVGRPASAARRPTTTWARRAPRGRARSFPTVCSRSCGITTRSCSARWARRSARTTCPPGLWSGACCSGCGSSSISTSICGLAKGFPARLLPTWASASSGRTRRDRTPAKGGLLRRGTPWEVATQGSVNTRHGVERCVRFAFELARTRAPALRDPRAQDERPHLCG